MKPRKLYSSIRQLCAQLYAIVSCGSSRWWSSATELLLRQRSPLLTISLPTLGELWQQERQLQRQALQLATAAIPQFRASDVSLVENLRELEELDPLLHNAAQLYQAELDLRAEGELLRQALTADIWWKIATPAERAAWRERVMKGV